jgi:hypothetical protein
MLAHDLHLGAAMNRAWRSVWLEPRAAARAASGGDAAGFVILVAWLVGILDMLQTSALRASMKAHWGAYALLLAVGMGPLLGYGYFGLAGLLMARIGRLLGGVADVSDTRVALAVGTIPELLALPFWIPVLAIYGIEIFTEGHPAPTGLLIFGGLQLLFWAWGWCLRFACLAEVNDFSIARAVLTVLLSWLAGVMAAFAVAIAVVGLLKK